MQMDDTGRSASKGLGRVWTPMIRLAGLLLAAATFLAMMIIGLFLVLPIMVVGGLALAFYIRRQLRLAQRRRPQERVINAEYTVIDHR
jgi:4-hydroxybenzoate polyprenyltransferase